MDNQKDTKDIKSIKQKIRDRYKGVSEDVLDVIPAAPHEDFYKSDTHKRVAVYARVSTDDPNQTSSYELQKNHYEDFVNSRANWELVDIYADEGISGTSLQHRDSFIRMIGDCRAGKIDMIVTKSVSRFARNIIDCIGYVRQLKAAEPPIGVYFETENIFTLDENSEMALSFIATLAQEESHTKSEIMNSSIEMRFKRGIFLTPVLLGYDHDEEGNLVINEDEANTVRLIFFSYLYGYSTAKIADALTELARLTKKGNQTWSASSVYEILTNERYCGDVLARKTFTPNYLNHKSKKNNHDRNQYRQKNHHAAIISREDFFAVQKMIRNAKYGNKGYFPEMHVVNDGLLRGVVTVPPKWAGFSEDDYYLASDSINDGISCIPSKPLEVSVKKGDFDLRGYELVRSQFMTSFGKLSVTISSSTVSFNKVCIDKMPGIPKIELLVMPGKHLLAIRKAPAGSRYALTWSKKDSDHYCPRTISGSAFLPTLYKLFGWRKDSNYRITGTMYRSDDDTVIIYDVRDAVLLIPEEVLADEPLTADIDPDLPKKKTKRLTAYPANWAGTFGESYYKSKAQITNDPASHEWVIESAGTVYRTDNTVVTTQKEAADHIKTILTKIGENNG
ncbi:MAG: recombinase family protein [Lachnospiraceae bacterium]|nr:recombinase family protein [Lachnospiraceae bacterium]